MTDQQREIEERGAAWLQRVVAEAETDPARKKLFTDLAAASEAQADLLGEAPGPFRPSLRQRLVAGLVRTFGPRRLRPILAAQKVRGISVYGAATPPSSAGHLMPTATTDFGSEHRSAGGGSVRAAVFGANDGLLSNTCLIIGVAGASVDSHALLLTGIAGLLAGAFSMASGEFVSVLSQRELFEHQIAQEREELARYPEAEAEELALIYAARGVPLEDARRMTTAMLADPEAALKTLAREELGLNPDDLGSPWVAAGSSFAAFAVGAVAPLVPLLFASGPQVVFVSAGVSAVCLTLLGGVLSLFSGRSAWMGGLRMLAIGIAAAGATYGIGRLMGVALA